MSIRPYVLAETNWKTVKATDYDVAVLPWGSTEAHNYHLPFGTDTMQAGYIATEAARKAWERGTRVVVLPAVPYGVNTGQLDIKLDMNVFPSTQAAFLHDILDAVSRTSIRRFIVLNGHGGNNFRQIIRELGAKFTSMFICQIDFFRVADPKEFFERPEDHAGEMETSVMMKIAPELVLPLEEAADGSAKTFKLTGLKEGWAWAERHWQSVTESTGVGDPALATREKGERYLDVITTKVARFYEELAAADLNALYE